MVELSNEEEKVILQGVLRVWDVIANDLLDCIPADEEPLDNEGAVESCLDSSWHAYSGVAKDDPAHVKFRLMTWSQQMTWVTTRIRLM